jgi:hypothetical protein
LLPCFVGLLRSVAARTGGLRPNGSGAKTANIDDRQFATGQGELRAMIGLMAELTGLAKLRHV